MNLAVTSSYVLRAILVPAISDRNDPARVILVYFTFALVPVVIRQATLDTRCTFVTARFIRFITTQFCIKLLGIGSCYYGFGDRRWPIDECVEFQPLVVEHYFVCV